MKIKVVVKRDTGEKVKADNLFDITAYLVGLSTQSSENVDIRVYTGSNLVYNQYLSLDYLKSESGIRVLVNELSKALADSHPSDVKEYNDRLQQVRKKAVQ